MDNLINESLINEVRKKKEFSNLPRSIIERAIEKVDKDLDAKSIVKEVRADLRKYFGVFLTNKVMKPKDILDYDSVLKSHKSSQKRDYDLFYSRIDGGLGAVSIKSIIDLGCGMNAFSYPYLKKHFGNVGYTGVEASGQIVDLSNIYFDKGGFGEINKCIQGDLFNLKFVEQTLKNEMKPRVVFLFQVVDALEKTKKNFSKGFILRIKGNCEFIVVSVPMSSSLSGSVKTKVTRKWLKEFLDENFDVLDDFEVCGERVFVLKC